MRLKVVPSFTDSWKSFLEKRSPNKMCYAQVFLHQKSDRKQNSEWKLHWSLNTRYWACDKIMAGDKKCMTPNHKFQGRISVTRGDSQQWFQRWQRRLQVRLLKLVTKLARRIDFCANFGAVASFWVTCVRKLAKPNCNAVYTKIRRSQSCRVRLSFLNK